MTVAGLVLAAGSGSRLGTPKALVELEGELLVDRAVRVLTEAGCAPVVVVLGAAAPDVVSKARLDGAVVIVNDDWPSGMGSSLRCGLAAATDLGLPGVVVSLVDQPLVTAAVVRRLIDGWIPGGDARIATYEGAPRNPALLPSWAWRDISGMASGDLGARAWLRAHPERVETIACDDLGRPADIDTPADLDRLRNDMKGTA